MSDPPDTPEDETFDERMRRLGIEIDETGGSRLVFVGPRGTEAMKKIFARREPPPDEPA